MHIIKIAVVEPTIMISRIIKLIMARPKDAELTKRASLGQQGLQDPMGLHYYPNLNPPSASHSVNAVHLEQLAKTVNTTHFGHDETPLHSNFSISQVEEDCKYNTADDPMHFNL
jgi:hypothetical protein